MLQPYYEYYMLSYFSRHGSDGLLIWEQKINCNKFLFSREGQLEETMTSYD